MSIYDRLNEQQKEAVFTIDGPVLILAGAGSGKTSVITHRIAYMIDEAGVNPYNILAITFTNKAASEMRERVDRLVGFGAEQIHVSTFHSMCVRILRRFADKIGYGYDFTIYDTDDQKQVMKEVCKRLDIDTKKLKERTIMNYISSCKDDLVTPEKYALMSMGNVEQRKVADCYREYQIALRKNNAMDFDDLLMKTVELFKLCPDVLNSYQERWKYIMVDEYQDTNTAQFELIRLMTGSRKNLCVVGDDDQSIYKFRGANIRNILDFEKYYPEAKVIKLEQNYRSVQNILDAANAVIRNNASRKDKSLWSRKEEGELIHFRQFDAADEEAEYVSRNILKTVAEKEMTYKDNAVLYRTNAQSRMIEERLVKDNVPYRIVGGVNFYSRREIKDLLAYLKTINNGADDLAVKRILNIPKRGIGQTTVSKIEAAAQAHDASFFDALVNIHWCDSIKGSTLEKINGFTLMIRRMKAVGEELGVAKLLNEILKETDYVNQMDVEDEDEAKERIENIDELVNKALLYGEENDEATLSGFLEEVALVADIDSVGNDEDRVLLMTIHSAKGLEFKNVYLIGMEDGLFPSYMSITSGDEEIQEERRLAYVGITRAKEILTLTCARFRMIHGETQSNPVSRFVREIPKNLFDIAPMAARKYDDGNFRSFDFDDGRSYKDSYDDNYSGFGRKGKSDSSYGGFSRSGSSDSSYGGFSRSGNSDSSYSGFSRNQEAGETPKKNYQNTSYMASYNTYGAGFKRPEKKTPESAKPFIAKNSAGVGSLTKGADISAASASYGVGDRVSHIKFGNGTVLKIEPEARDKKVTVQFDDFGQKIMYAGFAKLKRID